MKLDCFRQGAALCGLASLVLAVSVGVPASAGERPAVSSDAPIVLAQASSGAGGQSEADRIAEEEASFLKLVEEQRREEAEVKKAAAEAKAKADTEAKAKAEAEAKAAEEARAKAEAERVAREEESFMKLVEQQRREEAEAKKAAAEAKAEAEAKARTDAEAKAAEEARAKAEAERIAREEESFMRLVEEQRRQEAEAKRAAAEAKRRETAAACEKRLSEVGRSGTIQFASNSSTIAPASRALLDKLAAAAGACEKDLAIQVDGHTDATGPDDHNQRLSEERAKAVVVYLTSKGLAADRLTARGYGETQPIADNSTPQGRAKNRRIEFKVN